MSKDLIIFLAKNNNKVLSLLHTQEKNSFFIGGLWFLWKVSGGDKSKSGSRRCDGGGGGGSEGMVVVDAKIRGGREGEVKIGF